MHNTDTSHMNDETEDTAVDSRPPVLADGKLEIITQPVEISSDDAAERVTGRLSQKLWSLGVTRDVQQVQLRYKPYFEFEATLRKKIFRGDDDVYDGAIVVDGLTGVARPILKEQIETVVERVDETNVLDPELDVETAQNRANRNRIKVQQRESGKIELGEEPSIVYKPLWLVDLNKDVEVVDATNGQVFGDSLL